MVFTSSRKAPVALLVSVLVAISLHALTPASAITTLSSDKGYTDDIHLASNSNYVYVVWKDGVYADDIVFKAYFVRSTDRGQTFEEPIMMNTFGRPYNIQLIPSLNNIYFLWNDEGGLYFARSIDYGETLSESKKVKEGNSGFAFAAFGPHVYVSWADVAPDLDLSDDQVNFDVFVRSSQDYGATFSDPINISDSAPSSSNPRMVAANSSVYLVWEELERTKDYHNNYTISFATSHDGGTTFSDASTISQSSTSSNPSPAVSSDPNSENNFYVVWRTSSSDAPEGKGLLFTKTTDGGNTFAMPILISGNDSAAYSTRMIVGDQDKIYVSWKSYSAERAFSVGFTASSDGGDNFGAPVALSNRTGNDSILNMALSSADPDIVYIVWNEASPWVGDVGPQLGSEVLFARSDDGGESFHALLNLNKESDYSHVYHTDITANDNDVYVVWNHYEDNGSDVRFVRSTDSGITFDFGPTQGIEIQTDRDIVEPGMTALITGTVTGVRPGEKPLLSLFLPNGEPHWSVAVDLNEEGNFSYPLMLGSMGANLIGSYRIVISYGMREAETEVTLVPQMPATCPNLEGDRILSSFKAGNGTYFLQYLLANATVMAINTDFEKSSLQMHLITNGDGCLKLFLQSEIIEAENRNFTVTIDGQPSDFIEIEDRGPGIRTLLMNFTDGTKLIEVTGTRVVPEFPLFLAGIFLTSVISLISIVARLLHRRALLL